MSEPRMQRRCGDEARVISGTRWTAVAVVAATLAACGQGEPEHGIIPNPASVEIVAADTFHLSPETSIVFYEGDSEAERIGHVLAGLIGNSTETTPAVSAIEGEAPEQSILVTTGGPPASLGAEGYELTVSPTAIVVRAAAGAGLFYGVQTLRQLLPPLVEYTAAYPQPLYVPGVRIVDAPRFEWRGTMLDVSRHFLTVDEVKHFIDLISLYKLNRLHLHLADDQGWRIEIPGWPELTDHGGQTEVGGGPGGFYTVGEYSDLVTYAEEHFITVVPEIDVPGHTNAALSSYPELNCDGVAPDLYTGTEVGFSTLCPEKEITYAFLDDVIREISAITPGPYFHVGGDEVRLLSEEDYIAFIERVQEIVESHGKRMVGWDETAAAELSSQSTVQLWRPLWPGEGAPEPDSAAAESAAAMQAAALRAVAAGAKFIASPADRIYLDMKYDTSTILGLTWAGYSDLRNSYDWDVADVFGLIPEESMAGLEAPLWAETVGTLREFESLAFPRLAGVAELAWSPDSRLGWDDFRSRLDSHAERWDVLGVNYSRAALEGR